MGKTKEATPEIIDEIIEEPVEVKSPMRDADPEPEYVPAYQVVNERQDIYADKIPPKIMSLEALIAAGVVNETALAAYLDANGFVKNTDYASTDTGGVVKTSATYGTSISGSGALYGATRTENQYDTGNNAMLICKGTLENIKVKLTQEGLEDLFDTLVTADPAKTYTIRFYNSGAGPTVEFVEN